VQTFQRDLAIAGQLSASDPPKQSGQAGTVGIRDGDEFQPEPLARGRVTHDGISSDLPLGDEKLKIGWGADLAWRRSSQEETTETHVKNARDIVMPVATPTNPHFFVQNDPRVEPA
jgi:hypothetical protein